MIKFRAAFFLLLLTACGQEQQAALHDNGSALIAADVRSPLENAALHSGAIADVLAESPLGLYRQSHEAGADTLCLVQNEDQPMRFGLEVTFGTDEYCRSTGTARQSGDKLILNVSGRDHCMIVAQYDGDQIVFPGVTDVNCAGSCKGRGTLEGVRFPRVADDARSAFSVRSKDGKQLCLE